jgi:hypothetical protein
MKNPIADDTLVLMMDRLTQDDILLLDFLVKKKCVNSNMGISKTRAIKELKDMTDFKFQMCSNRLYLALLVNKVVSHPVKYYITKAGKDVLKMYKETLTDDLKEVSK